MSMTKRLMESGGGNRAVAGRESRARDEAERKDHIAAVFKATRFYHHAFVKSRLRKKRMHVYRLLYPHGLPSTTKFYSDLRQTGSLPAYLTHYFYCNLKRCLQELGLPPADVDDLIARTNNSNRYILRFEDAGSYAPGEEDLKSAQDIQPKPRHFRHGISGTARILHERSIQNYFTAVYEKNEMFYQKHPQALFKIELLDYQHYLQSPFWFVIRNIVLYRDGFRCRICSAKATTVHHISYDADVLYGKNLEPLISVCEPCHTAIEFDDEGKKITDLEEKKRRCEALAKMDRNAA